MNLPKWQQKRSGLRVPFISVLFSSLKHNDKAALGSIKPVVEVWR
jgi:hypothetical protein